MRTPSELADYHFASLVGLTAMGFIQPLEAYRHHIGEPRAVHLLVSFEANRRLQIKDIVQWLIQRRGFTCPIHIHRISESAVSVNEEREAVCSIYKKLEAQAPLVVNFGGGTNYLSFAGALSIEREDVYFIQNTREYFLVSSYTQGEMKTSRYPLPPALKVEELLALQGIPYTYAKDENSAIEELCSYKGIRLPENILWNVTLGGLHWDCVWNPGNNVLSFLAIRPLRKKEENTSILRDARSIVDFANTKDRTGNLLDRTLHVVTSSGPADERFAREGHSDIRSSYLPPYKWDALLPKELSGIFQPYSGNQKKAGISPLPKHFFAGFDAPTLITILGKSDATLTALATHKCKNAVLLYTPGNGNIESMKKRLDQQKQYIGLKRIAWVPCTHDGNEIPKSLDPSLAPWAQINSTPGTKGQGAWLGLWGKQHGVPVWAFESSADGSSVIRCLNEPEKTIPVSSSPLRFRLNVYLQSPVTFGWEPKKDAPDTRSHLQLLSFLRQVFAAKKQKDFLRNDLSLGGCSLKRKTEEGEWEFLWTEENGATELLPICAQDGGWFERLTAVALLSLPEESYRVAVNIKTDRHNTRPPNKTGDEAPFLTELDVLAADKNENMYAFSCKSGYCAEDVLEKTVEEVRSVASTFGRFVRPLACVFRRKGMHPQKGVLVIGGDVLCDEKKLLQAIKCSDDLARSPSREYAGEQVSS